MVYTQSKMQKKSLNSLDQTCSFEKDKVELLNFENVTIGRAVFEPGWSWDKCVKPIVKMNRYEAPHTYISNNLRQNES
jgi:hypothetical protein